MNFHINKVFKDVIHNNYFISLQFVMKKLMTFILSAFIVFSAPAVLANEEDDLQALLEVLNGGVVEEEASDDELADLFGNEVDDIVAEEEFQPAVEEPAFELEEELDLFKLEDVEVEATITTEVPVNTNVSTVEPIGANEDFSFEPTISGEVSIEPISNNTSLSVEVEPASSIATYDALNDVNTDTMYAGKYDGKLTPTGFSEVALSILAIITFGAVFFVRRKKTV